MISTYRNETLRQKSEAKNIEEEIIPEVSLLSEPLIFFSTQKFNSLTPIHAILASITGVSDRYKVPVVLARMTKDGMNLTF